MMAQRYVFLSKIYDKMADVCVHFILKKVKEMRFDLILRKQAVHYINRIVVFLSLFQWFVSKI